MRVISGQAKGTRLSTIKGMKIRPTSDKVKEAIFNIIFRDISGSQCLDLFAGTGALGIEALSRGASFCLFVEHSPQAISVIEKNLQKTKLIDSARIFKMNVDEFISNSSLEIDGYNLIFLDPPYKIKKIEIDSIINQLSSCNFVKPNGRVIIEHSSEKELISQAGLLVKTDYRVYGDTAITIYTNEV